MKTEMLPLYHHLSGLSPYIHATLVLIVGFAIITAIRHSLNQWILTRCQQPNLLPFSRFLYWGMLVLLVIISLKQLGFELGLVLQAAGFLTVALGFGLQGIASNFVCGLFLLTDKSFQLGDRVCVGDITGRIEAIHLLAISLIDDDQQTIRIPNETFFKSTVVNLSRNGGGKLQLTLFACSLSTTEIQQLLQDNLPPHLSTIECDLEQIDSEADSLSLTCRYQTDPPDGGAHSNAMLSHIAQQLSQAKLRFRLLKP